MSGQGTTVIFDNVAAAGIEGLRLSPLGAVATKKIRINYDYIFSPRDRSVVSSAVNSDTCVHQVPPCLCAEALSRI